MRACDRQWSEHGKWSRTSVKDTGSHRMIEGMCRSIMNSMLRIDGYMWISGACRAPPHKEATTPHCHKTAVAIRR